MPQTIIKIRSNDISHEAIINDELFEKVRLRQQEITATSPKVGRGPKHLLSGILRCPMCGAPMYAAPSKWKNKDGTERQKISYQCGHHVKARNGNCTKNAISAEWVETEVIEYTRRLVQNPQFAADVQAQIGQQTNGPDIDAEIAGYKKQLKKLETSKSNLERDIDSITDDDRAAERKRKDMNARLNKLYEDIYSIEGQLDAAQQKKQAIAQNTLTLDTVLKMLGAFGEMFDLMTAEEKRKLMETLIAEIQLHPKDTWRDGQSPIKTIKYTFPISREGVSAFMGENELQNFGENYRCVVANTGEQRAERKHLSANLDFRSHGGHLPLRTDGPRFSEINDNFFIPRSKAGEQAYFLKGAQMIWKQQQMNPVCSGNGSQSWRSFSHCSAVRV